MKLKILYFILYKVVKVICLVFCYLADWTEDLEMILAARVR